MNSADLNFDLHHDTPSQQLLLFSPLPHPDTSLSVSLALAPCLLAPSFPLPLSSSVQILNLKVGGSS